MSSLAVAPSLGSTSAAFDRRFGIEIEHSFAGQGKQRLAEVIRETGLNHWLSWKDEYDNAIIYDGTELELRSPILQGQQGLDEMRIIFDAIKANDGYVTLSDGFHVHHDAPEFVGNSDEAHRLRCLLVESWDNNQTVIDQFVHNSRWNHWACPKTWANHGHLQQFKDEGKNGNFYMGEGALNVDSLWKHGSIEFRQLEGTLEYELAEAWIKFGQAFIHSVIHRAEPMTASPDKFHLLRRINAPTRTCANYLTTKDPYATIPGSEYDEECYDCGYTNCRCNEPYCEQCDCYEADCDCGGPCGCNECDYHSNCTCS